MTQLVDLIDLKRGKPEARLIAASRSECGTVVKTFSVRGHRFILPEQNTHRKDSRSVQSSRGVPVITLGETILSDIAYPVFYGAHQKGMIAAQETNALIRHPVTGEMMPPDKAWEAAARESVAWAKAWFEAGYHKQLANRHQEPYSYFRATITATSRDNYYGLRLHSDAQPEIRALASAMLEAERVGPEPTLLKPGEWHTPWIEPEDWGCVDDLLQSLGLSASLAGPMIRLVSSARCARSSYRTFDGNRSTVKSDINLCLDLIRSVPIHASPFEHCCTPDERVTGTLHLDGPDNTIVPYVNWKHPEDHRNFDGFRQLRAFLERGDLDYLVNDSFIQTILAN